MTMDSVSEDGEKKGSSSLSDERRCSCASCRYCASSSCRFFSLFSRLARWSFSFAAFPLRMLAEVVVTVEIHLETVLLWNPLLLEETASQRLDAPAESLMMKPSPLTNRVFFVAHEDS